LQPDNDYEKSLPVGNFL